MPALVGVKVPGGDDAWYARVADAVGDRLAAIGGWAPIGTRVRWPYRSVDEKAISALRAAARDAVPELVG